MKAMASFGVAATLATMLVCPYPQLARYKGTGGTSDAANFVCRR